MTTNACCYEALPHSLPCEMPGRPCRDKCGKCGLMIHHVCQNKYWRQFGLEIDMIRIDVPPASIETKKTRGRMLLSPIRCRGPLRPQQRRTKRNQPMPLPSMASTLLPRLPETRSPSKCPPPLLANRRRRKGIQLSKERCSLSFLKREAEVDRRRARRRSRRIPSCTVRRGRRRRPRQLPPRPPRPLLLQRPLPMSTHQELSLPGPPHKSTRERRKHRPMHRVSL